MSYRRHAKQRAYCLGYCARIALLLSRGATQRQIVHLINDAVSCAADAAPIGRWS